MLVVGSPTALGIVVPTLALGLTPAWARENELANTESVELERDSDGWVLRNREQTRSAEAAKRSRSE